MQYRTLGRTGVQVSSLALGAMNFGAIGRAPQNDATAIVDARSRPASTSSTPPTYIRGESEQMVGHAIAGRHDDVVLATRRRSCRWTTSATTRAARVGGWSPHSSTACAA